MYGESIAAN